MKNILIHFKKLDWILIIVTFVLGLIGLAEIYSSSGGNFFNFKKQLLFLFFGFFLMILVSFFDWRFLKNDPYLILTLYFFSLISLAGLYFYGAEIRGVKTWYRLGPFLIDPIEFTKIIIIILLAKYFSMRHVEMYEVKHILISGFYIFWPVALIFFQPNFGSALILILLWVGILITTGIRLKHFLILCLFSFFVFIFSWIYFLKDYQKARILDFLRPSDPLGLSWSQNQAKIAIGSGGIFGQGLKQGSQTQLGFLPERQTDFIFAALCEETGLVGATLLLFLFLILFWRIMKIALVSNSNFPRLFSVGLAVLLISQVFVHVGVNVGLLPIIGISLPFVSYGGSNLLVFFLALGILQSIKVSQTLA